jgi:di/tricarboxylate transporter
MGGIALGKGVVSSGLFSVLDAVIRRALEGFSTYAVVLILSPIVLVRLGPLSSIFSSKVHHH